MAGPDPIQPAAPSLPTATPQASQLSEGYTGFWASAGTGSAKVQGPTFTGTFAAGTYKLGPDDGFGATSGSMQVGVGNQGAAFQAQQTTVLGQTATTQQNLIFTAGFSVNPAFAAVVGAGFEGDWGGPTAQQPRNQAGIYGSIGSVANQSFGNVTADGRQFNASGLYVRNFGITERDLNPKFQLGVEVKIQETALGGPDGRMLHDLTAVAGPVAAWNVTFDRGSKVFTLAASAGVGVEKYTGDDRAHLAWNVMATAGITFGGKPAPPSHESGTHDDPIQFKVKPDIVVKGVVQEVDAEHDLVRMDTGGKEPVEMKLSKLRAEAPDKAAFDQAMQHGKRVDLTMHDGKLKDVHDYGPMRTDAELKQDLLNNALVDRGGNLHFGQLTINKELAPYYEHWLATPTPPDQTPDQKAAEHDLLRQMTTLADKRAPIALGRDQEPPDFSRGSMHMPKLAVHTAADGKGPERRELHLMNVKIDAIDDKDGVTTLHYKQGGRPHAISFSDRTGGFGNDPGNPYNAKGLESALHGAKDAGPAARELTSEGMRRAVASLDAANAPGQTGTPLRSPRGTTAQDLFKSATFDQGGDVHIGNLTIKKDVAAAYLTAMRDEGPRNPGFIAGIERLATAKTPTELNLANTRAASLAVRDELGFGEPPNPLRTAVRDLQPGQTIDLTLAKGAATYVNRDTGAGARVLSDGRSQPLEPVAVAAPAAHHGR